MVPDYWGAMLQAVNSATHREAQSLISCGFHGDRRNPTRNPLRLLRAVRKGAVALLLGLVAGQQVANTRL